MSATAHTIYAIAAAVLGAGGLILLLWSLFWDRSRGRARCPKCWYRMEGVPAGGPEDQSDPRPVRTCPECGRKIRGERKLHKTRRRKRWAAVAVALLMASWCAWKFPTATRRGIISYMPATVLILTRDWAYNYGFGGSDVGAELLDRLDAGRVASWQMPLLEAYGVGGMIHPAAWSPTIVEGEALWIGADPPSWFHGDKERLLLVRARLPDAVELGFRLHDRESDATEWYRAAGPVVDGRGTPIAMAQGEQMWRWDVRSGVWVGTREWLRAGTPATGTSEVVFDWKLHELTGAGPLRRLGPVVWKGVSRTPVDVVAPGEVRGAAAVSSEAMDAEVAHIVRTVEPASPGEGLGVTVQRPDGGALADATIMARLELMFEGRVLAGVSVRLDPYDSVDPAAGPLKFEPTVVSLPAHPEDPGLVVRVRSLDRAMCFLDSRSTFWEGSVDVPLREILGRGPDS